MRERVRADALCLAWVSVLARRQWALQIAGLVYSALLPCEPLASGTLIAGGASPRDVPPPFY
eukprot:4018208-Pleurochrysis_carterae.AAC.1